MSARRTLLTGIAKAPTGIRGLDDVTQGGLPKGRPTLICGGAGSGKTLLAMEFLVRGARDFGEPGVFMAFEEDEHELAVNVSSLGFDVPALEKQNKLAIDHVRVERSEIEETGEYDLEGLFVRLAAAIGSVGAKRVVLDSLEALFVGLPNEAILRAELRRLFSWLKSRGMTTVITAEQGTGQLTRYGMEEYISDCVIFLDHRIENQVATRRLRVVKYRGTSHGSNEYPTIIDENGLSVLPISSLGLDYPVSKRRVPTGVPRLDGMLGGKGYYKGSSVLVSGTAGSGKSSLAASFADSVCRRGERCLYCSTEESAEQLIRNMASIGIDLRSHVRSGLLQFHTIRPTLYGLEAHLLNLHNQVEGFEPDAVIVDPISNLESIGNESEIKSMLTRLIDFLKNRGITGLFTTLTTGGHSLEATNVGVSSLMDTWILLRMVDSASERNRLLYVMKSRGMGHSNQMREFVLSDNGIELIDVYTGPGVVHTGSERLKQEASDQAAASAAHEASALRAQQLEQERRALEAQISVLQAKIAAVETQNVREAVEEKARLDVLARRQAAIAQARSAD